MTDHADHGGHRVHRNFLRAAISKVADHADHGGHRVYRNFLGAAISKVADHADKGGLRASVNLTPPSSFLGQVSRMRLKRNGDIGLPCLTPC